VKIKEHWIEGLGKQALALLGGGRKAETVERKTLALPSVLSPYAFPSRALPKPTPANLRKFAETPGVRRAINLIKERVAAMGWQVRLKRDHDAEKVAFAAKRARILRSSLEFPNASDSFRTLIEQAIEDALVGGFGAIEMELTGDEPGRSSCGRWTARPSASIPVGTAARTPCGLRRRRGGWERTR